MRQEHQVLLALFLIPNALIKCAVLYQGQTDNSKAFILMYSCSWQYAP